MAFETIRYDVAQGTGVATIALDQPETRNALSDQVLDELSEAFAAARDGRRPSAASCSRPRTRRSSPPAATSRASPPTCRWSRSTSRRVRSSRALFRLIGELGKPTLCAANGHVLAGSLGLALACDLIVAREDARFGTPEINVGVFPFMIMALIYRNVGRKKTNELLLLGEQISAAEAERIGIVNRVVAAGEFDAAVQDWAERLAAKSPLLMRLGKDAMFRQQDMAFADALEYLHAQLSLAFSTDDIQEGVKAFFEKRDPVWTGR